MKFRKLLCVEFDTVLGLTPYISRQAAQTDAMKKRSIHGVCEHFEEACNAAIRLDPRFSNSFSFVCLKRFDHHF